MVDDDWPDAGPQAIHEASRLLVREARLLDERRFDDWLSLYAPDGVYWVPTWPSACDPRTTISHAFDDVRRLSDRVYWLNTGLAFSQVPPSRTVHTVTNVEVLELDADTRLVRSSFATHEFRTGRARVLAGRYAHVLTRADDAWRIRVKRVTLLDADAGHDNLTLVL